MGEDGGVLRRRRPGAAARALRGARGGRGHLTGRGELELDQLQQVFHALAHPTRRHVLQVLYARGGAMTAGQLASRFAHSWPTTTRHLRELEAAGLVSSKARGRERHYVLELDHLLGITELWLRPFRS